MNFNNRYLSTEYKKDPLTLETICKSWSIPEEEFTKILDKWYGNFSPSDYELAFTILREIDFYSTSRIKNELQTIWNTIERKMGYSQPNKEKVLLIVPDGYGDSAHFHSYNLTKIWGLDTRQICDVSKLSKTNITKDTILIAFNDTYGTGNQFVTDMVQQTIIRELSGICWFFVVGLTISDVARSYLKYSLPEAHILPETSPKTIYDTLNYKDITRIEELGADIYPPHPLGYGRAGLLVAYEFQCPNNSIPLIWANSNIKNNEFEDYSYSWYPLRSYQPKVKLDLTGNTAVTKDVNPEQKQEKSEKNKPETHTGDKKAVKKKFSNKTNLKFTEDELVAINRALDSWRCSVKKHNDIVTKRLTKWFNNFKPEHKNLALKIFSEISYLSLARTREKIKNLRDKVMPVVARSGSRKNDIILVITGDELESSYHYIYDFMRKWGLQLSQVLTLKHICKHPYETVGKHLVFFYHTRIHRNETFLSEVWPRISTLPAKHIHILSFMMSEVTIKLFQNLIKETENKDINYYYCEDISKPLRKILNPNELAQLKKMLTSKSIEEKNIGNRFLTAYYFKCPLDTLSLLWYNSKINALFESKHQ